MSCQEEEPEEIFTFAENRCQFGRVDGIAEINGENRWLRRGETIVGYSDFDFYGFLVGGWRADCSLYEEISLRLKLERNSPVDGVYNIVLGDGEGDAYSSNISETGTAEGVWITRDDNSIGSNIETRLFNGTLEIKEIDFLRFEVVIEANTDFNNPISIRFTSTPN
jgi:hypothetical protein